MESRRGEIYIRRDRDTGFVDADATEGQLFESPSQRTFRSGIDDTTEREINPVCFGDVGGEQIVGVTDFSTDFQDISLGDERHFVSRSDITGSVPVASDTQNPVVETRESVSQIPPSDSPSLHTPVSVGQIEGSQAGWRSVLSGLGRYVWRTPVRQEPVNQSPPVNPESGARPKTVSRTSVAQNDVVGQNASPARAVSRLSDNQNTSVRQITVTQNRPAAAVSRDPEYQAPASVAVSGSSMRSISDEQTPVTVRHQPPRGSQLEHINQVHLASPVHTPADIPATPVYMLANPAYVSPMPTN